MKTIFEKYRRHTSLRAVFGERFNPTIEDLPKRPVFFRGRDANCVDMLPKETKQNIIRRQFSTKLTPTDAS